MVGLMASEHEARSAVKRATDQSEDMIQALEDGGRAAADAVARFLTTLQEALPQGIERTSEVGKKITESALEMAQQLIHTQSAFLRKAIDNAGKSLTRSDDKKEDADRERPSSSQPLPPRGHP